MIEASCLCGAVRLEIAAPPETVTACNCSACRRYGVLWAYYSPAMVRLIAARDATIAYSRGDHALEFHHCATCGCLTHWAPTDPSLDRMALNARLMDPAILAQARVRHLDGAESWRYRDETQP
jgi:hypothetical protein